MAPVSLQISRDFKGMNPRVYEGALVQLSALAVNSTYAPTHQVCFVSASVSIQFQGKLKRYDLLAKFEMASAAVINQLLRYQGLLPNDRIEVAGTFVEA